MKTATESGDKYIIGIMLLFLIIANLFFNLF